MHLTVPATIPDSPQRAVDGSSPAMVGVGAEARASSWLRRGLRFALLLVLLVSVQQFGEWVSVQLQLELSSHQNPMFDAAALLLVLAYTITMALPFVPGIEIGLAVMLVFGPDVFLLVYGCTQVALLISFVAGRLLPLSSLAALASWLQLHRTQTTLAALEPLEPARRLEYMLRCAPRRWVRGLIEHRYLALAVLVNLPGNAIVGGAGGIGLTAGMSRVFGLPQYVLVMALATTPVPIALWIWHGL